MKGFVWEKIGRAVSQKNQKNKNKYECSYLVAAFLKYLNPRDKIDNMNDKQQLEGTILDNFTPTAIVKELEIIDIAQGQGDEVQSGATITAHYTGALCKNGVIFQSSKDFGPPATFGLDQVITGWTRGVPGMKVGGVRRLVIPAEMAYGAQSPAPNIPPNSDLVFDIELVSIA